MHTARLLLAPILALVAAPAIQPQLRLVNDLNQASAPASSEPVFGAELPDGSCLFAATDGTHGRELWRLDAQGPALLVDIFPGHMSSDPRELVAFAGRVFFSASDGVAGRELWVSDGTVAGTRPLVDLTPGIHGTLPADLAVIGGRLWFSAIRPGMGREPHLTDGTAQGTRLVKDVAVGAAGSRAAGSYQFGACGSLVAFVADDGIHGQEIWSSDGTDAGTALVADLVVGADSGFAGFLTSCGTRCFFRGVATGLGQELFVTDGTAAGTALVVDLRPGSLSSGPGNLACCNGELYFSANDGTHGVEVFKSDGTAAGTQLVADVQSGSFGSFPRAFTCCGSEVFFAATGATSGEELFVTDGTATGTRMVADIRAGFGSSGPTDLACCNGRLLFVARTDAEGRELFASDGTQAGTLPLGDLAAGPDSSSPQGLFCCGNRTVFQAEGPLGDELYETDGTPAGTRLLGDLDPSTPTASAQISGIVPVGLDALYFIATTPATGRELFFFDGSSMTPVEVTVGPEDSSPAELTLVGDTLYFTATTATTGRELYRVVGAGTPELVADLRPGSSSSSPVFLTAFDSRTVTMRISTPTQGVEFAVARNGVPGLQVFDIRPGSSSSLPTAAVRILDVDAGGAVLLFGANDGVVGSEVFRFDGIDVALDADLEAGPAGSFPNHFAAREDGLAAVFSATVGGDTKVFRVESSAAIAFTGGGARTYDELVDFFNDSLVLDLLFHFTDGGSELVFALLQGQTSTSQRGLFEIRPDGSIEPVNDEVASLIMLAHVGSYYAAVVEDGDEELLVGSTAGGSLTGTDTVFDLLPGPESSSPRDLVAIGGRVWFTASGRTSFDRELYSTDGATVRLEFDGACGNLLTRGAALLVTTEHVTAGNELHAMRHGGAVVESLGEPCDERARLAATPPILGAPFQATASFGPAAHFGILLFDTPLASPSDFNGCGIHVDLVGAIRAAVAASSPLTFQATLPNDPAAVGARFAMQAVWLPNATILPLVSSNAVALTLGR